MKKDIFVVDDETIILNLFKDAFQDTEYTIVTCGSAEVAIEILKKDPIAVSFVDLQLPGMNGVRLCEIMREMIPNAIIYAITGHTSIFEHAACLEAGFNNYFKKPIDLEDLFKAVDDAFK